MSCRCQWIPCHRPLHFIQLCLMLPSLYSCIPPVVRDARCPHFFRQIPSPRVPGSLSSSSLRECVFHSSFLPFPCTISHSHSRSRITPCLFPSSRDSRGKMEIPNSNSRRIRLTIFFCDVEAVSYTHLTLPTIYSV